MDKTTSKKPRTPRDRYNIVTVPCGDELHKHLVAQAKAYAEKMKRKKPNIADTVRMLLGKAMRLAPEVWDDPSK